MSIPTIEQLMSASISDITQYSLLETGPYLGVITGAEKRDGSKAPYINLEVTVHQSKDGDETVKGRRVWRNVSFSEKALHYSAGVAELVQATQPQGLTVNDPQELPGALARFLVGEPIGIVVDHEQGWKDGGPQVDENGNPVMRETISKFFDAGDDFSKGIESDSDSGSDTGLPW